MGIKISRLTKTDKNKNNRDIMLNYSNRESITRFENLIMFKLKTKLMEMYELPVKNINYHMVKNGTQIVYKKSSCIHDKSLAKYPELESCTLNYFLTFNNPKFLTIYDFDLLLNKLYMLIYRSEKCNLRTQKCFSKPTDVNCQIFNNLILKIIMSNDIKRTTEYFIEFLYVLRDLLEVYPMYLQFMQKEKFLNLFISCTKMCNLLLDTYSKNK